MAIEMEAVMLGLLARALTSTELQNALNMIIAANAAKNCMEPDASVYRTKNNSGPALNA
ncbi:hypothetical protein MMC09_005168 [Bachmanniomyces sp. S44760]|nr:hypothetical protein [Bachmanniomyces sp. S44760]